jgi:gluconokinase
MHATTTVIVMGVSGAGKSTVAEALVRRTGWAFAEGDELHPGANRRKMAAGHPLTDDDRWPWLHRIADWIGAQESAGRNAVVTCSALRRAYREVLTAGHPSVRFVYLAVDRAELEARLATRQGHYMPAALLQSQLDTLEEPGTDEPVIVDEGGGDPEATVDRVLAAVSAVP